MYTKRKIAWAFIMVFAACHAPRATNFTKDISCYEHPDQALVTPYGDPQHWSPDSFPINLVPVRAIADDVRVAADIWNNAIGYEALDVSTSEIEGRSNVRVTLHLLEGPGIGYTLGMHDKYSGKIVRAHIQVSPRSKNLRVVLIHELGHLFGLKHDEDPFSVMFFAETPWGVYISDADIAYIRSTIFEKCE